MADGLYIVTVGLDCKRPLIVRMVAPAQVRPAVVAAPGGERNGLKGGGGPRRAGKFPECGR